MEQVSTSEDKTEANYKSWVNRIAVWLQVRGQLVLTCTSQGQVYFWGVEEGRLEAAIQAHESAINALTFHRGHFYTASRYTHLLSTISSTYSYLSNIKQLQ